MPELSESWRRRANRWASRARRATVFPRSLCLRRSRCSMSGRSRTSMFALTGTNTPVVEAICKRLDGIALAIELAAPRLRALSLQQWPYH